MNPEVVAKVKISNITGWKTVAIITGNAWSELPNDTELITLQSHREAMQEKALQYVALFGQLQEAHEAIAKKDAALLACVEAMHCAKEAIQELSKDFTPGFEPVCVVDINAAITQAERALK